MLPDHRGKMIEHAVWTIPLARCECKNSKGKPKNDTFRWKVRKQCTLDSGPTKYPVTKFGTHHTDSTNHEMYQCVQVGQNVANIVILLGTFGWNMLEPFVHQVEKATIP